MVWDCVMHSRWWRRGLLWRCNWSRWSPSPVSSWGWDTVRQAGRAAEERRRVCVPGCSFCSRRRGGYKSVILAAAVACVCDIGCMDRSYKKTLKVPHHALQCLFYVFCLKCRNIGNEYCISQARPYYRSCRCSQIALNTHRRLLSC